MSVSRCFLLTLFLYLTLTTFLLHTTTAAVADDDLEDDYVTDLDATNVDTFLAQKTGIVFFYDASCEAHEFCNWRYEQFSDAAESLLKHTPVVALARVNGTEQKALAERFGVKKFPASLIFQSGVSAVFNGPSRAAALTAYIKALHKPAVKTLISLHDTLELIATDRESKSAVVGFFPSASETVLSKAYETVATKLRDEIVFGKIIGVPTLYKKYGVAAGTEEIVIFVNGERIHYTAAVTGSGKDEKALESFVRSNMLSTVQLYEEKSEPIFKQRGIPMAKYYMRIGKNELNTQFMKYYTNRLGKVVKEVKGKMTIMVADRDKYKNQIAQFSLKDHQNALVIENPDGTKYAHIMEEEDVKKDGKKTPKPKKGAKVKDYVDPDSLIMFVDRYVRGKLYPWVRTQPEPKNQASQLVKTVVGSTFRPMISENRKKHVFVEFVAPWCSDCDSFDSKYTKLAAQFAARKDIVFTKFDAVDNEYDRKLFANVKTYPTFFLKPKGKNAKPVKYTGKEENIKDMAKFIEKHAAKKKKGAGKKGAGKKGGKQAGGKKANTKKTKVNKNKVAAKKGAPLKKEL